MDAAAPTCEQVRLSGNASIGIVTGQTDSSAGAVAHQKVLRNRVGGLGVRIVTTGAFHVAIDQLHLVQRVRRGTRRNQRSLQIGRVLDGSDEAKRMRAAQVPTEGISGSPTAHGCDFAVSGGLPYRDGAI